MATIRAYTTIEQSKKLAEILPLESADMGYIPSAEDDNGNTLYTAEFKSEFIFDEVCIPCWSLAALLNILPDYTLQTNTDGTVFVICDSKKPMVSDAYNNPIDACYEMIIKLHELSLL